MNANPVLDLPSNLEAFIKMLVIDDGIVKIHSSLQILGGLKLGQLKDCDLAHQGFERRNQPSANREICLDGIWIQKPDL